MLAVRIWRIGQALRDMPQAWHHRAPARSLTLPHPPVSTIVRPSAAIVSESVVEFRAYRFLRSSKGGVRVLALDNSG